MSALVYSARKYGAQSWVIAILPAAFLALANPGAIAQEATAPRRAQPADTDHTQYLRTVEDVDRLRVLRNRLIATATATLDARAKNPTPDNYGDALKSVEVLRILRASETKSLRAVCRNITLDSKVWEPTPLGSYRAAQALVEIGGRPAVEAVFSSMRSEVDRQGLLLRAFVLREIDSPEIASERVRIEIKSAEAKSLDEDALRDIYLQNLRQVHGWLNEPTFGNEENWP